MAIPGNCAVNCLRSLRPRQARVDGKRRQEWENQWTIRKRQKKSRKKPENRKDALAEDTKAVALEIYRVENNGGPDFCVQRVLEGFPQWTELAICGQVDCNGTTCGVGDEVLVLLDGPGEDARARIQEIRDLEDGRFVLLVAWHIGQKECRRLSRNKKKVSIRTSHVLTNQLDAVLWDTVNDKIDPPECISLDAVLDVYHDPPRLFPSDDVRVAWLFSGLTGVSVDPGEAVGWTSGETRRSTPVDNARSTIFELDDTIVPEEVGQEQGVPVLPPR
jgi:hypothetical protein